MHEIAITVSLISVVNDEVRRCGGGKVTEVAMSIGGIQSVEPDSIKMCFDLLVEGTDLEGAVLNINRMPILIYCNSCMNESVSDGNFHCIECGSSDVKILPSGGMIVNGITLSQ